MAPVPVWCLELDEQHDLGRRWPGWMFMRERIYTVIINKKKKKKQRQHFNPHRTHTSQTGFFLSFIICTAFERQQQQLARI
jgi:hypothetical protein